MYIIAILGDLASLIPVVNMFSGAVTAIALSIAGTIEDVSLWSDSQVVPSVATFVAEEIPMLSALPLWTIRVYFAKRAAKRRKEQAQNS